MNDFAKKLLAWYDTNGRKDLPWQKDINAYRVWVSEIMLQQTQVSTVIDYYERFMTQFPDVDSLANAKLDQVLHLWTGLGYYARARNLHKTAQRVRDEFNSQFPDDIDVMQELPGIGRSTAAAILSIANHQAHAILDGNVKRVLTRVHAVEGWPGDNKVTKALWQLAEQYTPKKRVADYTQAIMDLGATLCTRSSPNCEQCPMQSNCQAFSLDKMTEYPHKKPKKEKPIKSTVQLMIIEDDKVLLEKRPLTGIWGGLHCFIECEAIEGIKKHCQQLLGYDIAIIEKWVKFRHTFSHYHLDIQPVLLSINKQSDKIMDSERFFWYKLGQTNECGLAAPVKRLLQLLESR